MVKISSSVFLWKVAVPLAVLAHCIWLIAGPLLRGAAFRPHDVLMPVSLALAAFFIFKTFVFDLADSVEDFGDHFIVRKARCSERIELANVAWVDFKANNPPRVTLHLVEANPLGQEISFYPATSKMQMALHNKSDLVVNLNQRLARAKEMALA